MYIVWSSSDQMQTVASELVTPRSFYNQWKKRGILRDSTEQQGPKIAPFFWQYESRIASSDTDRLLVQMVYMT